MNDLHNSLLTFDTHIDIPWPDQGDAWSAEAERQVNIPKTRQGGLGAVCLAAYIPQGQRDDASHDAAWQRVREMLTVINAMEGEQNGQRARICRTARDVRQARADNALAIVPAIENGHALGGVPERLGQLARAYGVRYMTLTHNGHNALADAAIPRKDLQDDPALHDGLSALGQQTIREMNRHGVLVDVSHAAKSTMMQASELSRTPVFASHSCARALCDHPRNLDDEQLDRLKETGGLIQVTAMGSFLKKGGGGTLDDLVRHVTYIANRIGVEHVGISSDFDGGGGIDGWRDATETSNVTAALQKAGFSPDEISAIWGGNMLRLLERAEQAMEQD
ncbi:dipeptidase [Gluconobacter morbifer]|uniref:Membrane-bound dipeptidase n=1 Tax=Gluconobacter morbifer G707 TaxID=1088869 RepID=G6XHS6_9PROT|nr:dipeptidase [Gluconobacter morbifer]EHH68300.1 membrane-bound dipeptidase [Gluconobacter morbifer G707]